MGCSTAPVWARASGITTAVTPRGLAKSRRKERSRCSNERQSAADQRLIGFGFLGSWIDQIACRENRWSDSPWSFEDFKDPRGQSWSDALRGEVSSNASCVRQPLCVEHCRAAGRCRWGGWPELFLSAVRPNYEDFKDAAPPRVFQIYSRPFAGAIVERCSQG